MGRTVSLPKTLGQTIEKAIAGGISGRVERARQAEIAAGNELDELLAITTDPIRGRIDSIT